MSTVEDIGLMVLLENVGDRTYHLYVQKLVLYND